jgi:hypothetical protein
MVLEDSSAWTGVSAAIPKKIPKTTARINAMQTFFISWISFLFI